MIPADPPQPPREMDQAAGSSAPPSLEEPPSVGVSLLTASGIVNLGGFSARALSFVIGILLARLLTTSEFGSLGVIQNTVALAATISSLSLGLSATKLVAAQREVAPQRAAMIAQAIFGIGLLSVVIATLFLGGLAPWIASKILARGDLITAVRLAGLQLLMTVLFGICSGILLGLHRFGSTSVAGVLQNIAILIAVIVLVPLKGLTGAVLAQGIGLSVSFLWAYRSARDVLKGATPASVLRSIRSEGRSIMSFSLPTVLGVFTAVPAGWAAVIMFARVSPDGYEQMAYFAAADRFRMVVNVFGGFFVIALLPILAGLATQPENWARSRRGLELALVGSGVLVLPPVVLLSFAGPYAMGIFGPEYREHWTALLPLLLWASGESIIAAIGPALLARGHQWFWLLQQSTYSVSLVLLAYLLRAHGASGLAASHVISLTILFAWSYPWLKRMVSLTTRSVRTLGIVMCSALIASGISVVIPHDLRIPVASTATLISIGASVALLTSAERRRLLAILPRRGER